VRRRVEALLRAHDEPDRLLDHPAWGQAPEQDCLPTLVGDRGLRAELEGSCWHGCGGAWMSCWPRRGRRPARSSRASPAVAVWPTWWTRATSSARSSWHVGSESERQLVVLIHVPAAAVLFSLGEFSRQHQRERVSEQSEQ
jgi:hypothetical protein